MALSLANLYDISGECAVKVCQLVHCIESLPVDGDVGFNVWLSWSWLMHYLRLICADYKTKVVAGIRELVNAASHVSLSGRVEGAVIAEQEVVDGVIQDLGFEISAMLLLLLEIMFISKFYIF